MTVLTDLIFELLYSDVGGHPVSPAYRYSVTQVAHFGLGAVFGAFPRKIGLGCLGLLVVKELVADIPRDGWAVLSMVDSVADIACIGAGLLFTRWAMRRTLARGA